MRPALLGAEWQGCVLGIALTSLRFALCSVPFALCSYLPRFVTRQLTSFGSEKKRACWVSFNHTTYGYLHGSEPLAQTLPMSQRSFKRLRGGWGNGGSAGHRKTERSDRQSNNKLKGMRPRGRRHPLWCFSGLSQAASYQAIESGR